MHHYYLLRYFLFAIAGRIIAADTAMHLRHQCSSSSSLSRPKLEPGVIWEVGGYVSKKLKASEWGSNIVRQLSEYIRTQDPTIKGWSYRTIYKMVQFYKTYSSTSFKELIQNTKLAQFTKQELTSTTREIVPFKTAQIPTILFSTGWTNHQIIMIRCKSDDERLFYILFAKILRNIVNICYSLESSRYSQIYSFDSKQIYFWP